MSETTEQDWRFWVFERLDDYRRTGDARLLSLPTPDLPLRLRSLFAAVVETLAIEAGAVIPNWCREAGPLAEPWFVAGVENLKASALVEL